MPKKITVTALAQLVILVVALVAILAFFKRDEIYRLFSEASGEEAQLVVRADLSLGPMRRGWAHLAQGGEDLSTNMLSPVAGELAALTPQTVRLDHIYDGYGVVGRDGGGSLTFDWTRLDEVVATIRQTGAVPMLALSYMPPAISAGDIIDVPRDWNEWALVVQRTIEHYSGTLAIPNVAYEVWNEPDLFGGWKTYGDKNYLTLYSYAAAGAARAQVAQPFLLGGPATTKPYFNWIEALLTYTASQNVRLDFVSWHEYSFDMDDYVADFGRVSAIVARIGGGRPIRVFITETGPDSDVNVVYDGAFGAAHMVALARVAADQVERVYTFEVVDGKDPGGAKYWGRWGLLTHPDTGVSAKPRYRALLMLNTLVGERVAVVGEGTWVRALAARGDDGVLRIVVVNYDRFGRHTEEGVVTVQAIEPGGYTVTKRLLGGGEVVEELTALSNRVLQVPLALPANSVYLLEIASSSGILIQ